MTYSNPGDTIMDFCMGSGSCGVSAKITGRNFIGIEKNNDYFKLCESRINEVQENTVKPTDHQLTTQIHSDMKTTPYQKFEKGKLEQLRNQDYSVKDDPKSRLFE
jgi:DNA modification methylase